MVADLQDALRSRPWYLGLLAALVWMALAAPAYAQQASTEWIDVEMGKSHIHTLPGRYRTVLVSDPEVAEVEAIDQDQFSVRGLTVGSTDLWIWLKGVDEPLHYLISVRQDLTDLARRIGELSGSSNPPRIYPIKDRLVVDGPVADLQTLERITAVARLFDPEFVNLMSVQGDHQVQLEVVFAEVSRTAMREMGLNVLWGDAALGFGLNGPNSTNGGGVTQQLDLQNSINFGTAPAPSTGTFSILGVLDSATVDWLDVSAILSVLEQYNISKILAEPTLVALSGQQAEFLAGGEIPIPVAQTNNRITVEFKEYGVKLVFVPTVLADEVVDMRVYIEVSEIDGTTGTRITGIEIPGFVSRKGESYLRIENGRTFAMAGMLSDSMDSTRAKIPILGEIPIVGAFFSYNTHRRDETELMIFVTPRLVRPLAPEEVPPPPGAMEDNNPNDFEFFLLGLDHRLGSRGDDSTAPSGPVGMSR